jgi:DNA-binding NtrC family response regulator
VLLTGETGTGKTHLARVIHHLSPRKDKPFVVVHCADLAPTLLESELFGHVRGAFTGAERDHPGKFAEARDGTILIDEIDSLPRSAQGKLLRAVDEREFEAVGSTRPQQLRARLIVATNRSLEAEVAAGHFRRDLFYRLNVVSFCLPPLCQRREVIRPLVQKFLADFCRRNGCPARSISGKAIAALEAFDWPGNIRELRNVVERALALCPRDTVETGDLPEPIRRFSGDGRLVPLPQIAQAAPAAASNGLQAARRKAELNQLLDALQRHNNNRTRAAESLGISRVTLYKKLHQYGLA